MNVNKKITRELSHFVQEHENLAIEISSSVKEVNFNQILVQKMKRQQAQLRNKIAYLQSLLLEDIVA